MTKCSLAKKSMLSLLGLVVIVGGFAYLRHQQRFPSTDDAYVQAYRVAIAAEVTGPVKTVHVQDQEAVSKGQLLFTIDPEPFELALAEAQAKLEQAYQAVAAQEDAITTAEAKVSEANSQLHLAQKQDQRISTLVKRKQASNAEGDEASTKLHASRAQLQAASSTLQQAKQNLGKLGESNAQIRAAQVALAQAKLNLAHTHIIAPADGIIANFNLRQGAYITTAHPLFALIENNTWWVSSKFKETALQKIHPGQTAKITLDMYPGHPFTGRVESISPGSESSFSLLPAENASGNWVKVTQRFQVKVLFDQATSDFPLRVGASSKVIVDTKAQA